MISFERDIQIFSHSHMYTQQFLVRSYTTPLNRTLQSTLIPLVRKVDNYEQNFSEFII